MTVNKPTFLTQEEKARLIEAAAKVKQNNPRLKTWAPDPAIDYAHNEVRLIVWATKGHAKPKISWVSGNTVSLKLHPDLEFLMIHPGKSPSFGYEHEGRIDCDLIRGTWGVEIEKGALTVMEMDRPNRTIKGDFSEVLRVLDEVAIYNQKERQIEALKDIAANIEKSMKQFSESQAEFQRGQQAASYLESQLGKKVTPRS